MGEGGGVLSRLEPDFHGERRASAGYNAEFVRRSRGGGFAKVAFVLQRLPTPPPAFLLCRLSSVGSCNGLIRNSADAFGVNTGFREKRKLIRGSLITRMVGNREEGEKTNLLIIVNWKFWDKWNEIS